ncbi:unnamed protein product [Prunus armeniaca]
MTAMMQWQVNRQFRKDREAAMARIPNPDEVVQQLDLPYGPPPGLAWPYQENPLVAQIAGIPERGGIQAGHREVAFPIQERLAPIRPEGPAPGQVPQNQQEPQPAPQQAVPQDHPMEILPEQPAVVPYRPRRMDPNPFPPPARGRRGRGGNYPYVNNDRNRQGANWRNHPGLEEPEEHREEVLPRPYRAEPRFDHAQPEQGQNLPPVNALNDVGALQRMIREMMEPEARRGERPTYRKPYPPYIDQIPLSPGFKVPNFTLFNGEDPHASSVEHVGRFSTQCIAIENNPLLKLRLFGNFLSGQAFTWYTTLPANSIQTWEQMESVFHDYYYRIQPEVTVSDLAALKQSEDEPAQDFINRFRKLKMKCRIPIEERHFIQMAQAALKISLRKRFDGMLFGDLAELADKAAKYEELLREEQQKRNSSKGTYYKSPSSSIHMIEVESEEDAEESEEREVAVAEMAKLKHPISCKTLTKPPRDQKPPPFTGGFVPNKPMQNKVYSFDLTKVDALFDEMLLQKAIETPHRMPKPEELKGRQYCRWHNSWNHSTNSCVVFRDVIQEGITAGRLKLAEKPPSVTTDPFPQPQVNMVNLNWPERKKDRPAMQAGSSRSRIVSKETMERPKATISAGIVLCSRCNCEAELEVVPEKQELPIPSVFDRIGTTPHDRTRQRNYPRPVQSNRRVTKQPKEEISIKVPESNKPLAAIIEGRWYSIGKNGRPTMELTRTQRRRVQRQYCTFLNNEKNAQVLPNANSARKGKEPELLPQTEQAISQLQKLTKAESSEKPSVHPTPASGGLLETPQLEERTDPISEEGQEDWVEEDEEEQLDYEPSTDDQNTLLGTEELGEWAEKYDGEQMDYDGELDAETEAFGAELEDLLRVDPGINMVFILPEKFWAVEGQKSTLDGDVFSQESFECRLAETEEMPEQQTGNPRIEGATHKLTTGPLCFSKPTKEMANHLRPLFITANFGGVPIPKTMVDGGAAINLLPHRMLSKMGRTEKDLIPTRLTVTNFAGGITKTLGILDVDVLVGSKKLKVAFFVVDTTSTTYNALLGRDWIHQSLCVPSTLHQQLALWNEDGYMEIVEADPRPFLPSAMCCEARYYHDDLGPFTFFGVNQNGRPHGVTAQRLIEEGLTNSLEDWNRPFVLNFQSTDV